MCVYMFTCVNDGGDAFSAKHVPRQTLCERSLRLNLPTSRRLLLLI